MADQNDSLLPAMLRGSYATRLGVALAFAVVVMLVFGAVLSVEATNTLEDEVRESQTGLAGSQANELDAWLQSTERSVRASSDSPVLDTEETDAISEHLQHLVESEQVSTNVAAVHYLDTETMTFEASSDESFVGVSPAEQGAAFAENPPTFDGPHDTFVTEPFAVGIADHPIIAVLSPVTGQADRVLVYMTDLRDRTAALSQQQEDAFTVVVDSEGQFVAHPNGSKILSNYGGNTATLDELSPGERAYAERDEQVMGMQKLQTKEWVVMAQADKAQAFALSDQINSGLLGLILLAVINLGLVGVTVGTDTITSLQRISERAREMGNGNLDVDLSTSREDEIGVLYQSFDRMRKSLRNTVQEAEDAREEAERARQEAEQARQEAERESEVIQETNEELEQKATEYRDVLGDAASGDLTRRVDPDSTDESMAAVGEEINTTLDALEEIIATTQSFARDVLDASDRAGENAERVDRASTEVRDSIAEISRGTSEQSSRLQEAASEMEGLSATAEEVSTPGKNLRNS